METSYELELTRVKVYKLDGDGQWRDEGTGHIKYAENDKIVVEAEVDPTSFLIDSILQFSDRALAFYRQQETLIVWKDPILGDVALSFQHQIGCDRMWEFIESKLRFYNCGIEEGEKDWEDPISFSNDYDFSNRFISQLPETPKIEDLKLIDAALTSSTKTLDTRESVAHFFYVQNYIQKLIPLFETSETSWNDLESSAALEDLFILFNIVKTILFLNDTVIYETLIRDDIYLQVVGMLEYDPDFKPAKANYRDILLNHVKFKQLTPMEKSLIDKIQSTYRIQFLRDVVMARFLEDSTFALLQNFILINQYEILNQLQQEDRYLKDIFALFEEDDNSDKILEAVSFLKELCGIAKTLQFANRSSFYNSLCSHGLLLIFEKCYKSIDINVRIGATAILCYLLEHDSSLIRSFSLAQHREEAARNEETLQSQNVMTILINLFVAEDDIGLKSSLAEALRILIESPKESEGLPIAGQIDSEIDDFLTLFYDSHMKKLLEPIYSLNIAVLKPNARGVNELYLTQDFASILNLLLEILTFSVRNHGYRSKYFITGASLCDAIVKVFKCSFGYLKLSALRFFRTCINCKDEAYNRHLIKNNVFQSILESFHATEGKYNLFNSACLELFDFIRRESIKPLIIHIVEKHGKMIEGITYTTTLMEFIFKYEQLKESDMLLKAAPDVIVFGNNLSTDIPKVNLDGWGKVDRSEEDYFNENDDDMDTTEDFESAVINSTTIPLVATPNQLPTPPQTIVISKKTDSTPLVVYDIDEDEMDVFPVRKRSLESMERAVLPGGTGLMIKNFGAAGGVGGGNLLGKKFLSSPVIHFSKDILPSSSGAVLFADGLKEGAGFDISTEDGKKRQKVENIEA